MCLPHFSFFHINIRQKSLENCNKAYFDQARWCPACICRSKYTVKQKNVSPNQHLQNFLRFELFSSFYHYSTSNWVDCQYQHRRRPLTREFFRVNPTNCNIHHPCPVYPFSGCGMLHTSLLPEIQNCCFVTALTSLDNK